KLPPWLKSTTFSGMVWRDNEAFLVASRQSAREGAEPRTIVFVEPLDSEWTEQLQDKSGMTVRMSVEGASKSRRGLSVSKNNHSFNIDDDDNGEFTDLLIKSVGRKVIWADVTALTDWNTGATIEDRHNLFTLIVNPYQN